MVHRVDGGFPSIEGHVLPSRSVATERYKCQACEIYQYIGTVIYTLLRVRACHTSQRVVICMVIEPRNPCIWGVVTMFDNAQIPIPILSRVVLSKYRASE
jgi:hypothetical protein